MLFSLPAGGSASTALVKFCYRLVMVLKLEKFVDTNMHYRPIEPFSARVCVCVFHCDISISEVAVSQFIDPQAPMGR